MNGVLFNNKHCYNDYNFYMVNYVIGKAEEITHFISVPGRLKGKLDLTEIYGYPLYDNRKITINLRTLSDYSTQLEEYSEIKNNIHNQTITLKIEDDENFYYVGRAFVGDLSHNKKAGNFQVVCDCQPYKLKNEITTVTKSYSTSYSEITLNNLKMPVVPTINATVDSTIKIGDNTYSITSGETTIPDLLLLEGEKTIQIKGNNSSGSVVITYQEGSL